MPASVIARLPGLLRVLEEAAERGWHTLSSDGIARSLHGSGALVRKDLSFLGFAGTRGVGYDVAALRRQVASTLQVEAERPVAIVGMGRLGSAMAGYAGFSEQGFRIAAAFDADPAVVGRLIDGASPGPRAHSTPTQDVRVLPMADLETVIADRGIRLGIIAVPSAQAQGVADRLVGAGVVGLLSFARVVLVVPDHVEVCRADLAAELQVLAFHARAVQTAGALS